MSQFIESICLIDGEVQNLAYHQQRVNETLFTHFFSLGGIDLREVIPEEKIEGKAKLRIVYNEQVQKVDLLPYQTKAINSLKLIEANKIDYSFKSADRDALNSLFDQRGDADDIIIVQQGHLTDASYANLAFWDGSDWYTPSRFLLAGTKRQSLLDKGWIRKTDITMGNYQSFEKVSLINAMLDLGEVTVPDIQK
ncbi:MAG: aminotransferase class IV [Cyclobacteriaceae bacterium]